VSRALAVLLLAAGCSRAVAPTPPPAGPPTVAVVPVISRDLQITENVPAEIYGWYWIAIYPRVPAFAEAVLVDRASHVHKGQILARLSAPELSARRAQAEATMIGDRATMVRLRAAARTPGAVSQNEVELAEAKAKADEELMHSLSTLEGYLRVTAPFDGVISERNVHPGALVGPGSGPESLPLFRLNQISRLRVTADVPEADVGSMVEGARVSFTVRAWPGERFEGVIRRPAYALATKTRTMPVELDFENTEGKIEPGMYAEVLWPVQRVVPSFFVPPTAVVRTTERLFVDLVENGVVRQVDIKLGLSDGALTEVFGPLGKGALVVSKATEELLAGSKVIAQLSSPDAGSP